MMGMLAMFRGFVSVTISSLLLVAFSEVAAAHEGEVHITQGFALTPLTIAIMGAALVSIFLSGFLLWTWASRSLKRKEQQLAASAKPSPSSDDKGEATR